MVRGARTPDRMHSKRSHEMKDILAPRFQRARASGNLTAAKQAAFEIPLIPLANASALVELYAQKRRSEVRASRAQVPDELPGRG